MMNILKKILPLFSALALLLSLSGCAPEVGSDQWCSNMKQKDKADWTVNEATDYAKHCLLK